MKASCEMTTREKFAANYYKRYIKRYGSEKGEELLRIHSEQLAV